MKLILISIILTFVLIGCSASNPEPEDKMIGTWIWQTNIGQDMQDLADQFNAASGGGNPPIDDKFEVEAVFFEDGTFTLEDAPGNGIWEITQDGSIVSLSVPDEKPAKKLSLVLIFEEDGNTLKSDPAVSLGLASIILKRKK